MSLCAQPHLVGHCCRATVGEFRLALKTLKISCLPVGVTQTCQINRLQGTE